MALLSARTPGYPSNVANYRVQPSTQHHGFFASPTESEFSEHYDTPNSIRNWDEERVAEWLRSINCSQYVSLFIDNNITGANLMDLDRSDLREIGVTKVGDQIRIASQAKNFRTKEFRRVSKIISNRESLALLDNPTFTPPSSASPKPLYSARSVQSTRSEKRMSRQISDLSQVPGSGGFASAKPSSRPTSPYIDQDARSTRARGYASVASPQRDQTHPVLQSAARPTEYTITSRYGRAATDTPQTARFAHHRPSPSTDSSITNSSILPVDKALIRVIFDTGRTSVVSIEGCKTVDEIMLKTLRKGNLNENHIKNYCFHVLDGTEPNSALCRRINESEVSRICSDRNRLERNRLILRKIHMGEPDEEQLKTAASIATQIQLQQSQNIVIPSSARSQEKIRQLTGEPLQPVSYPLSPSSAKERQRQIYSEEQEKLREGSLRSSSASARARRIKDHFGGRPPSELIASDLSTYFPDFQKEEIDKTVRMSVRRSRRISRAASRLSTVSNFSVASSLMDAPPLPSISDAWTKQSKGLRPLSVLRLGGNAGYRDSIASSVLEPLDEESPLEPDRKSYISFADSEREPLQITDPDGHTTMHSYYDDARSSVANSSLSSGDGGDSLNKRLSHIVHEDSEESDEELNEYLEADSWDNIKYMKGALIGQGSFGSVYLALHAVTGELMAVKQVEMPTDTGTQLDAKKKNMVEALKHEIGLLRELKHENIVQYLGSNSDDTHLNIFLEYVPGGSVATMLVNYGPLGESLITNFVRQILNGLCYLHSKDIIHRDIKGANILVDNKGSVKISDFGISKRVEASSLLTPAKKGAAQRVSLQGSVFWMAPEVVRQTAYTRKADIWSLGCLIVEMLTGQHPHPNCTQMQAIFKIGSNDTDTSPTIPDGVSEDLRLFLARTFHNEHEKRPTAEDLLMSSFITKDMK
ncbi:Pkinase-domain-containing protein [Tothia fuscella]|uniref:mitogen-activated protein kinase kinase kinase n=1 Tax=Tothia fuscella TaxID=1048955 RepID=A0A9P4NMY9_9PEZI|nr:Pkinase-domain-containing protein [Tothia fuscella]